MEEEIVTNTLSVEQLQDSIPDTVRFFNALGLELITVEYGWGCNLPTEQLWQPFELQPSHLQEFIEESRKNGIFTLGASDLIIRDLQGSMSFTLCHESDLHFVSSDKGLLEQVATMWGRKAFVVYISPYIVEGRREWRRIDETNQAPPLVL